MNIEFLVVTGSYFNFSGLENPEKESKSFWQISTLWARSHPRFIFSKYFRATIFDKDMVTKTVEDICYPRSSVDG